MITYLVVFATSYVFIFLKAWQQLNVVHRQYLWVMPTSMCLACCEVYLISTASRAGFGWIVFVVGLGAGLGAMTSMYIHGKMVDINEPPAS